MLAQVHSFVLQGIDPLACEVEVDIADQGLPKAVPLNSKWSMWHD
tara:strand:- start:302 stop:436 length:135 start_codon:yes stop_codon:yes gene_type:complete